MKLYIIRHTEAVQVGDQGVTLDDDRPLTEHGHAQAKEIGSGMQRKNIVLDKIVTSPLLRARQTAEMIVAGWEGTAPALQITPALIPGSKPRKLGKSLEEVHGENIGLVGHMPHLGKWTAWLIGSKKAHIDFAKGAVALVQCSTSVRKGSGALRWMVTPEWW